MAGMAVFYVAGYLIEERRRWPVITAAHRSFKHGQGAKTIKKNTNSTQNKSETHRAKQYEVTSFLSTDCEWSTETCSKNVYSLGPRCPTPRPAHALNHSATEAVKSEEMFV